MYNLLEQSWLVVFPFLILICLFGIQVIDNFIIVVCDVAIIIFIMYDYIIVILNAWLLDLHELWSTLMIFLTE